MAIANKTCVSGKKVESWRYVVEAFYLYAKLIFGRRQFCVYTKDRKLLSQQKEAVYQHTCINAVKIFVRIFGLLIYFPGVHVSLCRPNNVEFSGHAEKSVSNSDMHILASPGYAPWTIAVNVTWLKRGFDARQSIAACSHLSSTVSQ